MQRKHYFLFVLLVLALFAGAQKKNLRYGSLFSVGAISGFTPVALQLQTVQGVTYKTWSAGIGAGIDYYHTRSVPLFLQLRRSLTHQPQTPFVYVNGGWNIPWAQEEKTMFVSGYDKGLYGEGGIGYEVPVLKKHRLFFSGGWQVKTFSATVNTMPWLSVWPPPPNSIRVYDYTLQTLVVKTGLRF